MRDDEVDVPILCEQRCNFCTGLNGLHERGREPRARERCLYHACERGGGASGFLAANAALEDRSIA